MSASRYALYALSAVGALTVASSALRCMSFVRTNYLTSVDMKRKYGKAGNWAVVTGASEGIGHAMALDLGRRGFNVCVIARTKAKLDAVVEELRALGVEGQAISFDFAAATPQSWSELFAQLDKLEIAVLVNNVGVNYTFTNYFENESVDTDLRLIKVNCESNVQMTKYVLPKMKAKQCGAIVILSSVSAVLPTPLLATYAGTKAFGLAFGKGLYFELKQFGIDVLTVTPNVVVSKMTQGKSKHVPRESFMMVNANAMAHQTLDKLGSVPVTAGHRNHAIIEDAYMRFPVRTQGNDILRRTLEVKVKVDRYLAKQAAAQSAQEASTTQTAEKNEKQ